MSGKPARRGRRLPGSTRQCSTGKAGSKRTSRRAARSASTSRPPTTSTSIRHSRTTRSAGRRIYAVNMQLLNYPDKPAAAGGNQPRSGGGDRPPDRLEGRKDVHVHGQERTQVHRRLAGHRGGVRARVRPGVSSRSGVAGGRVRVQRRQGCRRSTRRRAQPHRRQGQRPEADHQARNADPTFISQLSMPFFAAVKPNMPINAKGENKYPSAGPYTIESRDAAAARRARAEQVLQGQPARRTRTGS